MNIDTLKIVRKANKIVTMCGTRDPNCIAKQLGIRVLRCKFKAQKGAYKVILRNRFIFLSDTLSPTMETIVLAHELGHDALHRSEAMKVGGFQEFNLFDMTGLRMEYEANIFAAQLTLMLHRFKFHLVRECLFARQDMLSLQIAVHHRDNGFLVREISHDHRHGTQSESAAGSQSAVAGYQLVAALRGSCKRGDQHTRFPDIGNGLAKKMRMAFSCSNGNPFFKTEIILKHNERFYIHIFSEKAFEDIKGEYIFSVLYEDIAGNEYEQLFPVEIVAENRNKYKRIDTNGKQRLIGRAK